MADLVQMKRLTLLALVLLTAGCGSRYVRHDATDAIMVADIRACQYEAYKADHWKDNDFIDHCMGQKSYTVDEQECSTAFWFNDMKDRFANYDKKKGLN